MTLHQHVGTTLYHSCHIGWDDVRRGVKKALDGRLLTQWRARHAKSGMVIHRCLV